MQTAKALGFKKGDFVHTGLFPGILIGDVHTTTPLCEVWGLEHECGSAYANELRKLTYDEFVRVLHTVPSRMESATTAEAKKAIKAQEAKL